MLYGVVHDHRPTLLDHARTRSEHGFGVDDAHRERPARRHAALHALEQLCGSPATARSDQFALCVCLWEALVGSWPFRADGTIAALVVAMCDRPALVRALDRVRTRRRWLVPIAAVAAAVLGAHDRALIAGGFGWILAE